MTSICAVVLSLFVSLFISMVSGDISSKDILAAINFDLLNSFDTRASEPLSSYRGYNDLECYTQLAVLLSGISNSEKWAIQVADSWGKIPAGLLFGNIFELGNFDQCLSVSVDPDKLNVDRINGQYCLATMSISELVALVLSAMPFSSWKIGSVMENITEFANNNFTLGTCFPSTCSPNTISTLLKNRFNLSIELSEDHCYQNVGTTFTGIEIFSICFFSVVGMLMIFSTIYDLAMTRVNKSKNKYLNAFSVYTNGEGLFKCNRSDSPNIMNCLNGIRALSIIWIVFGHTHMMKMMSPNINSIEVSQWPEKILSSFVLGAPIAVDTFFLLSGLLVTWSILRHLDENAGKINILQLYFHRYLRLTPALAAGILFFETLSKRIAYGPMHHMLYMGGSCTQHWWSTLLYIQNYVNKSQLCFAHSWYLTTDMQLFILSPLIIYPLWRWKSKIIYPISILILTSMVYNFVIFMLNDYSMKVTDPKHQQRMEETYYPIYARMGVYLIGVLLANFLHNNKGEKVTLSKITVTIGWMGCLLSMASVLFAVYPLYQQSDDSLTIFNSLYIALSRIAWGLSLSWLIFTCVHDYGGPVNWLLSLPQWQPISRLSYCIYLVHYPIQVMMIASVKATSHFSEVNTIYSFWGDFGFAVCVATVWSLAFESPFFNLEKALIDGAKSMATQSNENLVDDRNKLEGTSLKV